MNETVYTGSDPSSGMATASLILGLLSVIMIVTGASVIIGSVGVILSLLSRGSGLLSGKARSGLITSMIGIIGGMAVTLFAFHSLFSGNWDQALSQLNSLYESYITNGTLDSTDIDRIITDTATDKTALGIPLADEEETDL